MSPRVAQSIVAKTTPPSIPDLRDFSVNFFITILLPISIWP